MAKSAREKFDEYLSECRETSDAVNEFLNCSYEHYKSYAHAAGSLCTIVQEVIRELPKAKRVEFRERFYSMAKKQKEEHLIKILKETK